MSIATVELLKNFSKKKAAFPKDKQLPTLHRSFKLSVSLTRIISCIGTSNLKTYFSTMELSN